MSAESDLSPNGTSSNNSSSDEDEIEEEERPLDIPSSVGSRRSEHSNASASSISSSSSIGTSKQADVNSILPSASHEHLLEPPAHFDLGRKPKTLGKRKILDTVQAPRCCMKKGKTPKVYQTCVRKFNEANDIIKSLQELADKQNDQSRSIYDKAKKHVTQSERFVNEQYKRAQKIVQQKNKLADQLSAKDRIIARDKSDYAALNEKDKDLKAKLKETKLSQNRAKKEAEAWKDKFAKANSRAKEWRGKCMEARAVSKEAATKAVPSSLDPLERERMRSQIKLDYKIKAKEHDEEVEARRKERRDKAKQARASNGIGLLGTNGIWNNGIQDEIKKSVVS